MISEYFDKAIERIPGLESLSQSLAGSIHQAVLNGGEATRSVADLLHGTWLGHPLHPVLTDVPIGAWTMATIFDGLATQSGSRDAERAADTLTMIGVVTAVPTAVAGITDYSTIPQNAAPAGMLHGLLNTVGLALYILSLRERKKGNRSGGVTLSAVAYGILTVSAWIGGELVYKYRVGVNHNEEISKPEEWVAVLSADELGEHQPRRVEAEGEAVLLYRYGGTVYAIGAVCSHDGGPLEEGKFEDLCVQCPWHDSVFDLRDGRVVHGPATYVQPDYAARIQDGQVQVRLRRG